MKENKAQELNRFIESLASDVEAFMKEHPNAKPRDFLASHPGLSQMSVQTAMYNARKKLGIQATRGKGSYKDDRLGTSTPIPTTAEVKLAKNGWSGTGDIYRKDGWNLYRTRKFRGENEWKLSHEGFGVKTIADGFIRPNIAKDIADGYIDRFNNPQDVTNTVSDDFFSDKPKEEPKFSFTKKSLRTMKPEELQVGMEFSDKYNGTFKVEHISGNFVTVNADGETWKMPIPRFISILKDSDGYMTNGEEPKSEPKAETPKKLEIKASPISNEMGYWFEGGKRLINYCQYKDWMSDDPFFTNDKEAVNFISNELGLSEDRAKEVVLHAKKAKCPISF